MSTGNDLENLISCDNKDLDCCTIFKMMAVQDSAGNAYLRIYDPNSEARGTFTNADLNPETIDGTPYTHVLTINHGLGTQNYGFVIRDENGAFVSGLTDSPIDNNSTYIIMSGAITGTWTYYIFA